MPTNTALMQLAVDAALAAARFIETCERPPFDAWDHKGQSDFATEVDRQAERIVADTILAAEPDSTVIGEELSPNADHSGLTWIVDPLDGTTNFLHGFPVYAVSVAAAVDGELVAGAVRDIPSGITYRACAGGGAWRYDRRLTVSGNEEPARALIGTGFPFKALHLMESYKTQLERILTRTSGVRRAGAAALDLSMVASGVLDGFWELILAPWDVAAGTILIREAGGVVTDLDGSDGVVRRGPIVAGNPRIHEWLIESLRQ